MRSLTLLYIVLVSTITLGQNYSNLKFETYSTSEGLSSSTCTEIYQDKDGFLWFGTIDGLNKFDGYSFEIFKPSINEPNFISNNRILSITGDDEGNLWIGTWNGLNVFDRDRESFFRIPLGNEEDPGFRRTNVINDVYFDKQKNSLWAATNNGAYQIKLKADYLENLDGLSINYYNQSPYSSNSLDHSEVTKILKDHSNNIWIATNGESLNKYKEATNSFERVLINTNSNYWLKQLPKVFIQDAEGDFWIGNDLSKMIVWDKNSNVFSIREITKSSIPIFDIYVDSNNVFWITTDGHGIYLFDKHKGIIKHLAHDENSLFSLPNNQISSILEDKTGVYWLSTYNEGICKLVVSKSRFEHYYHRPGEKTSLSSERAQSVLQDNKNRIWIGTDGGGLNLFNRETKTFKHFLASGRSKGELSSNKITYLESGYDNNIWVCTWDGGLNLYNPKNNSFKHYVNNPKDRNSIGDNSIWCAKEDKQGGVWIGTQTAGLNLLDKESKRFIRFMNNPLDASSIASNFVFSLFIDSKNRLFVGTSVGLNVLFLEDVYGKGFKDVKFKLLGDKEIQGYRINFITEDKNGNIWVGTDLGLHKLNESLKHIRSYTHDNGLPNDLIVGIQEDKFGYLWITSKGGLTQFNPITEKFINYGVNDGVQGIEFQSKSITLTHEGHIIVGGIKGVNIFDPKDFIDRSDSVVPVLSQLRLFNKPIHVGDTLNNRVLLTKNLWEQDIIELKHYEGYLSFDFVALYFESPEHVQYAYRMKGLDEDFVVSGLNRTANYSNLTPGDYEFEVKASLDGDWENAAQTQIAIHVLPPPWKSWWAYSLYFLFLSFVAWISLRYYTKLVKEEKEHELDQMKLNFFINVAHEFRTPLTLILNPVDKILESLNLEEAKQSGKTIQQSSHRLLNLVNQILDFRRVDMGKAEINLMDGDIINFTSKVFGFFKDMASQKNVNYNFSSDEESYIMGFDPDKIEKILTNLLSNALKYTEAGGEVKLEIQKKIRRRKRKYFKRLKNAKQEVLEIKIVDTGIGFPKEHLKYVFNRFYKADNTKTGTGIGLNYTRSLVELLGGEISIESIYGEGSTFTVQLPVVKNADENEAKQILPDDFNFDQISLQSVVYELDSTKNYVVDISQDESVGESDTDRKPTVLLVEDNKLLQSQLKQELEKRYSVTQAFNGAEGLEKALKYFPDIIVSDIMMPEMDGFELCEKLKENFDTCHIPVVLLTARSLDEDKIAGFKTGADDYIPKPFNMQVLKARIQNLIESRIKLREKFDALGGLYVSKEVTTNSTDEAFLDKATKVVVDHIDQSDFNLDVLLQELSVSRSTFFRKITSITGHSPTQFIRSIRLKYAAELLLKKDVPIKEIAYMSGFNSTSYFSKTFREHYGMTPNEYVSKH
ncbi:hybrid sensor histidine kinase/response regulator transcription factor [Saccharicrinis fermentans]|uniref:histidine kinase n=1 Tax=Saccharicrinis fermentans DSM 9555 = JCM 21142 TaxID=869213 RepID=W7Y2N6_9BACT|nr:hybrid sensor histidine kinase/response regulator transcription factor [Saccharicrinis fermentans]GAF05070.1 autoinducer 2 sensor kinase/phosphatase LuxQ [Saccharicrinis fermentans DSM 9555 = JCM 21142]